MVKKKPDFMKKLTSSMMTGDNKNVADIITFAEAQWGLNLTLTGVQKVILKCFNGMELDNERDVIEIPDMINDKILYRFSESEFLQWCYDEGRCNTNKVKGKKFTELVLVLGRRSGKSFLCSIISAYEMYKLIQCGDPSALYSFPPSKGIVIMNVAPTDDQAKIVFEDTLKMSEVSHYLGRRIVNRTLTYFNLQTDADARVGKKTASIKAISGGCSANGLRGQNSIIVIMDEMAFFIDNGGRFSGDEVYKALTPSTATFSGDGKIIAISSPYAKYGKFYDIYNQSFDEPDTALMFRLYSAAVNSPRIDKTVLQVARRRDRSSFMTEYGAEFSDSITAWIEEADEFKKCIVDTPLKTRGEVGVEYFMGIDLGLKNDGTAISIVHRDDITNKFVLDYATVWYSGSSDIWERDTSIYHDNRKFSDEDVLKVSKIVDEIEELLKWFPIRYGWFDQFSGEAFMQKIIEKGLKQFEMVSVTDTMNSQIYSAFKEFYIDGQLELPNHPVLVPEILSLEAEKRSKNKVIVRAPNKRGAHDDISDSFVRAVWGCYKHNEGKFKNLTTTKTNNGVIKSGTIQDVNMDAFRYKRAQQHGVYTKRFIERKRGRK